MTASGAPGTGLNETIPVLCRASHIVSQQHDPAGTAPPEPGMFAVAHSTHTGGARVHTGTDV